MINVFKRLSNKRGFTLVEVSVSTVAMASLLSIFALIPKYHASLNRVALNQKAQSIIKEVTSQIENHQQANAAPTFSIDGAEGLFTVPVAGQSEIVATISGRHDNTMFTIRVSSRYVDATDFDGDGDRVESIDDGSNTGNIIINVSWPGLVHGSASKEVTLFNTAVFN